MSDDDESPPPAFSIKIDPPPAECPKCHRQRIARISYGFPSFSDQLNRDLDEGRIVLGGCVVGNYSPSWRCLDCGHSGGHISFDDDPPDDAADD